MNSNINVAAVVVHFHPSEQDWENTYNLSQFVPVLILDNTVLNECQNTEIKENNIEILPQKNAQAYPLMRLKNKENKGIAKALNQGIKYWQTQQIDWCFLFDQDSKISSDFVEKMLAPILATKPWQMKKIAAWVPKYYAANLETYGAAIQVHKWRIKRLSVEDLDNKETRLNGIPVSYAITSGSLINMKAFDKIGMHDESLFIDFVDIEWGLRANAKGYSLRMNPKVTLIHELGSEPLNLFGKKIVTHAPLRHYYYFRNLCHLLKMAHVPTVWKITELIKLPLRFGFYGLFSKRPWHQVQTMLSGLKDGLNNIRGKKNESTDHR